MQIIFSAVSGSSGPVPVTPIGGQEMYYTLCQRRLEVWLVVSPEGALRPQRTQYISSASHRENWKDCAISSSWIRLSSNKRTSFDRCSPPVK